MNPRRVPRIVAVLLATLALLGVLLGGPQAGLAADPKVVVTVTPAPPIVTLATVDPLTSVVVQQTYAAYEVFVQNNSTNTLNKVHLDGSTSVTGGSGGETAPFDSSIGASCTTTTTDGTSISCPLGQLNGKGAGTSSFVVIFKAPAAGATIVFSWTLYYSEGSGDSSGAQHLDNTTGTSFTTLGTPVDTEVRTYVPASGATFYTGTGIALSTDSWATTVTVPRDANAHVLETAGSTEACPDPTYTCLGDISTLTIPGTFSKITVILRLDASRIRPPGAKISNAKVFYKADGETTYAEVLNCTTPGTVGPDPCISSRIEYTKKNTTNPDLYGDWEFVIIATHNGSYHG